MEDLRYPIGNFEFKPFSNNIKNEWLLEMKKLPNDLLKIIIKFVF